MSKKKNTETFGIIGMGRFGFALAQDLAEAGKEVLVMDQDQEKIKKATAFTDNAFVVGELTKETLQEAGLKNCDTVVICIGDKVDTSILTTLTVINLGIPRVISKATTTDQGCVLEKLGAEVVYPERDMALRVAKRLIRSNVMEFISLNDDIDICELMVTKKIAGIPVEKLNLRPKYGLNIIAAKRDTEITTDILPGLKFSEKDLIVVLGKRVNIQRFEDYIND